MSSLIELKYQQGRRSLLDKKLGHKQRQENQKIKNLENLLQELAKSLAELESDNDKIKIIMQRLLEQGDLMSYQTMSHYLDENCNEITNKLLEKAELEATLKQSRSYFYQLKMFENKNKEKMTLIRKKYVDKESVKKLDDVNSVLLKHKESHCDYS